MSESPTPHRAPRASRSGSHRLLKVLVISVVVVLVVIGGGGFLVYRHLNNNIQSVDTTPYLGKRPSEMAKKKGAPHKAENVLLIGSDTRKGQTGHIGGATPGLSDTTILLHLSADRKLAYGVSLPRDAMVNRPSCERKDGKGTDPATFEMFNEAYAVGGAACTQKTVEHLTGVRVDHYVVIDFNGFKDMVNALGGVEVCVPTSVDDTTGHIQLKSGTYNVKGQQALDYVRVRHDLGTAENGDIGRMKRQQAFLASMSNKVVSAGTLINPIRLYKFANAATKSLTTDPGLDSIGKLTSLARSFKGIGLSKIQFLTVPFQEYAPNPNRLQWAPSAHQLWKQIIHDQPVNKALSGEVTTAENKNGKPSKKKGRTSASAEQVAAANGLCS